MAMNVSQLSHYSD